LKERKNDGELRLLMLELGSLLIRKDSLRWLGRVGCKDNTDWIKHCTVMEMEGIRPRGCLRKMCCGGVEDDLNSFILSQNSADAHNL